MCWDEDCTMEEKIVKFYVTGDSETLPGDPVPEKNILPKLLAEGWLLSSSGPVIELGGSANYVFLRLWRNKEIKKPQVMDQRQLNLPGIK